MTLIRRTLLLIFFGSFIFCPSIVNAQASCIAAATLTPSTTCSNPAVQPNLQNAISAGIAGSCSGVSTTTYSVWYKFTATATSSTITVGNLGSNLNASTTYMEVLTGTCGSQTSIACQTVATSLNLATTITTVYYIRVYVTSNPTGNPASKWNFDICVTNPVGDECSNATTLVSNSGCINTAGNLVGATASSGIPSGCASTGTHYDQWYKFVAVQSTQTITFKKNNPSNISNPELQLFSGTCGSLTSLQCGTTSIAATGLTPGATYYVRVSQVGGSALTTRGGFDICVTHYSPPPATIDFSKSYVNITKGTGGGNISPGDTLEVRATFVVRSGTGTADSLAFFDTLFATDGLRLVPGTLALRTNEGKLYKSFTDNNDVDAGWKQESANNLLDTAIQINFGANASNVRRGSLTNTSRPSVFGSTCIIMATYRVVVTAPYNNTINLGGGSLSLYNGGNYSDLKFGPTNVIVYQSPGLCPNAVSPTNALGAESNGTFGAPSGGAPLARNRGTSPYTTYTYKPFTATGGPNDYYYAVANNTSQVYTTLNNWPKPDGTNRRLFQQWDITGDHTSASNTTLGNSACDTTQAKSATNPCGYMLVINSAYRTDTAFTYAITNLCPNTYYELSAWFKNICYKCGCDSTGTASGGAGYIPTATGDSSGVRPNIAFDVNGVDYYTTGDLLYLGLSGGPTGSDAVNQWVKRGFTYLTGPAQTSFTLTLRNNAPGGGGNDWALDDIAVVTCSPDLNFTPSTAPTVCDGNTLNVSGTVTSYFNNYIYYKWQKRADGASTWVDDTETGNSGVGSPTVNGSGEYEYTVAYGTQALNISDNNIQYRLITATTLSNLSTSSCSLSGGSDDFIVPVIEDCTPILGTHFISFNAKQQGENAILYWTTNKETELMKFIIEGSDDGRAFTQLATINSNITYSNALNSYTLSLARPPSKYYYRIKMVGAYNGEKYSRILGLDGLLRSASLVSVINPFRNQLVADIQVTEAGIAKLQLIDNFGVVVKMQNVTLQKGNNPVLMKNTETLPSGMYTLKLITRQNIINKKLIKQ